MKIHQLNILYAWICQAKLDDAPQMGELVQIDESLFNGKRKYNRGRLLLSDGNNNNNNESSSNEDSNTVITMLHEQQEIIISILAWMVSNIERKYFSILLIIRSFRTMDFWYCST